ncbi:MAG: acyl-CoA dehydrogenase family protein, partial [Clostridia bacterium]|nr:acyl-CoA dehydrogenase family protein [Clostridia bacterium]
MEPQVKYELFGNMIKEFAETEVKPLAHEVDEQERFPAETVEKMAEIGLLGITVPQSLGGAGGDMKMYIGAVEQLSKVCATTGVILSAHTSLCVTPIMEYGTEEQKQKYVPRLASGEWLGAFGLTEPNAGTDAKNQQTIAVDMGDHYIINGTKIFITNGGKADVYVIFAMTDKSLGLKGITAF